MAYYLFWINNANYLSEKIDDKQDIDNEKIAKVINQKGLYFL